jgi:intergrase/recombinase
MFKNFFNNTFGTFKNPEKNKKITFAFFLNEVGFIFSKFFKKLSKSKKKTQKPASLLVVPHNKLILKFLQVRANREINKRIFHIKEELLYSFPNPISFFKKE